MKSIINAYLSIDGVKEIATKSFGDKPNLLDKVAISDTMGNVLQLDAGVIYKAIVALAAARKLTVDEYFKTFKNTIE
jgi:hypothetical protein